METPNDIIKEAARKNFSANGGKDSFEKENNPIIIPSLNPELNHYDSYNLEDQEMQTDGIPYDDDTSLDDLDDDFLEDENLNGDETTKKKQDDFAREEDDDFLDEDNGNLEGDNVFDETLDDDDDDFLTEDPNLTNDDLRSKNSDHNTYN
jgi:hypothetical protein